MAILFSQVNIADAADVNPSGTNTSQVALSDDANKSNGEVSTESTVSDEINGTTESESRYRRKQVKTRKMKNRNRPVEMLKRNQQII